VATNLDFEKNKNVEESVNSCSVISKKDTTNNESEHDLVISGSAVFKNYKLVGYMKEKETRGMNWLKGKIKYGNISIQFQDEDKVNLSILSCRSNLEASIVSNEVYIDVNVREKSNINEIDEKILGNLDFNSNPHILDYLSKKQDEFIYNEIMSAVNMSKNTFSADIFGFGDLLYKEHPKEWNKVKENWNENFKDAHINVNVSSQINQTGILSKSIDY
jgi:spore germination protein KC